MTCISLFASEILAKGLVDLTQSGQMDYLHALYVYYTKINQAELLKNEVMGVIAVEDERMSDE